MAVRRAGDIQPIGLREGVRIAVGGSHQEHDQLALPYRAATDLDILIGDLGDPLRRALETQELLHRGRQQAGFGLEAPQLVRLPEQPPDAAADQGRGGLVAAYGEGDGRGQELGLREPLDAATQVRRPGAGRKSLVAKDPDLLARLDALVEPTSRGDPMCPLRWTSKSTGRKG